MTLRRLLSCLLPAVCLLALLPGHAWAAPDTVTSAADDNSAGTLRAVLAAASPGDTINFASTVTSITLGSPLPITKNVTIQGPATGTVTITSNSFSTLSLFPIITVSGGTSAAPVVLNNLTVTGGFNTNSGGNGGGVLVNSGATVTLNGCSLSDNDAATGGGLDNNGTATLTNCTLTGNFAITGAGIANAGTLTMTDCGVNTNGNDSTGGGATTSAGGGIDNTGTAFLTDCTVSGDSAEAGGGVENTDQATLTNCVLVDDNAAMSGGAIDNTGTAAVTNCSFSGNTAPAGHGGAFSDEGGGAYLTSDVLYGDTGGEVQAQGSNVLAAYCDIDEAIGSSADGVTNNGHNLIQQNPDFVAAPSVSANGDQNFGDLHLTASSPLFAAGASQSEAPSGIAIPTADFDGFTRPTAPSIGAYEAMQGTLTVNSTGDAGLASGSLGVDQTDATTLRAAVGYANAYTGVAIGFDSTVFATAQTITLTQGGLTLSTDMSIEAASGGLVTVNGGNDGTVFTITGPGSLLSNLGITGGGPTATFPNYTLQGGGGVVVSASANATLTGCTIFNNNNAGNGGGITSLGIVTLTNCALSGNTASVAGGGLYNNGHALVTGCFFGQSITNGLVTGSGNTAPVGGGGIYNDTDGTLTMNNSVIAGNSALDGGGGLANVATASTYVTNCVFVGNSGGNANTQAAGGGVLNGSYTPDYYGGGSPTITPAPITFLNCTFTGNTATYGGGAIYSYGDVVLVNDIFDGDNGNAGTGFDEVASYNYGGAAAYNCDFYPEAVSSEDTTDDGGNINANPDFVTPYTSSTAVYDLRLGTGSAAIRAGNLLAAGLTAPTTDITGATRPTPPSIGAFDVNATNGTGPTAVSGGGTGGGGTTTPATTTLTASASPTSATADQNVTLTANVSPAAAGSVTFTLTPTTGSAVTEPGTSAGGGQFTANVPAGTLSAGTYTLSATFTPTDPTAYSGSTASGPSITVTNVSTGGGGGTTTTPTATTVSVPTANPASPVAGTPFSLSATVTPTSGTATPTGTVTFFITPNIQGDYTFSATGTVDSSGVATTTSIPADYRYGDNGGLVAGTYSVVAQYNGDANNQASAQSAPLTVTVTAAATPPTVLTTFNPGLQMVCLDETYTNFAQALNGATPPAYDTYNGSTGLYVLSNSATEAAPAPGMGFWIAPSSALPVYDTGTPATGTVTVPLTQGWNLIGDPFSTAFPLANISVTGTNGQNQTGLANAYTNDLLYGTLYTWGTSNTTDYTVIDGTASGTVLTPFTGYWLYAFQSGETLTMTEAQ